MVAFGGVVVDHIQDDFDPGLVQSLDHLLEFGHRRSGALIGGVLAVRREEADRVVSPVVAKALVHQVLVVNKVMNRHEFDRRNAKMLEIFDNCRMRQARESPLHLGRNIRGGGGQPFDVRLVNDRFVPM